MALIRRSIPVANFALTALIAAAVAFGVVAAEPVQPENAGGGKVVGGGKKTVRAARSSAASASPRVTADVLHRCSMDAANAWGVVIDGKPGPRASGGLRKNWRDLRRENAGAENGRQQQGSKMPHVELRLLGDETLASRRLEPLTECD